MTIEKKKSNLTSLGTWNAEADLWFLLQGLKCVVLLCILINGIPKCVQPFLTLRRSAVTTEIFLNALFWPFHFACLKESHHKYLWGNFRIFSSEINVQDQVNSCYKGNALASSSTDSLSFAGLWGRSGLSTIPCCLLLSVCSIWNLSKTGKHKLMIIYFNESLVVPWRRLIFIQGSLPNRRGSKWQ